MQINGKKLNPYVVIIPLPREDGDVIFQAKAILSYDKFDALCPLPKPPLVQRRGENAPSPDYTDEKYNNSVTDYSKMRTAWMVIEALSATPGLKWEQVNPDDSNTWRKWEDEFTASGLSDAEKTRIFNGVIEAQGLDDRKIEAARARFLASLPQEQKE